MNTKDYVIHGGFVYDADDWHNSHDADRYDDIQHATVNCDHVDFPDSEEKINDDLELYWEKGVKPSYVI